MTITELEKKLNGNAWFSHGGGHYENYPPEDIEGEVVDIYEEDDDHYFELSNGVWGHIYGGE